MIDDTVEIRNEMPPAVTPSRGTFPPRRRWLILFLAVVILAMLAGTALWFLALSPKSTSISLQPPQDAKLGQDLVVAGQVSPSGMRTVTVSRASSSSGPWVSGASVKTDGDGQFAVPVESKAAGAVWVRATVLEDGRMQETTSAAQSAYVRAASQITVKPSVAIMPTTATVTFTGSATPAGSLVSIEQSPDGLTWTTVRAKVTSNLEGAYSADAKGLPAGTWLFRARVAQSDTATESVSKEASVRVEDFKAAGAKYLAIMNPFNKVLKSMNNAEEAYYIDYSETARQGLQEADAALSSASTIAATRIRAYNGWPKSVAKAAEGLAASMVLEADALNQMSMAENIDERDQLWWDYSEAADSGSPNAIKIRDLLHLPKRA